VGSRRGRGNAPQAAAFAGAGRPSNHAPTRARPPADLHRDRGAEVASTRVAQSG